LRFYFPPLASDELVELQPWLSQFEALASPLRPSQVRGFYLWWHDGRLVLYRDSDPVGVCLQPADFERRARLSGELARACGVTAAHKPRVLDAMAGLGVDGMTLSTLGCPVMMIERHAALWALLDSFLKMMQRMQTIRASNSSYSSYSSGTSNIADRSAPEVVHADAWDWLADGRNVGPPFDVVYLDPMFPVRRKGALPSKPMQFLSELTEPDPRSLVAWVELGRRHACERVVLKRRLRDPLVGDPDWQIKGRSVRYDVYRPQDPQAPRNTA
jgi:16S rRNA (guanine1516-N2)-methyltransferase